MLEAGGTDRVDGVRLCTLVLLAFHPVSVEEDAKPIDVLRPIAEAGERVCVGLEKRVVPCQGLGRKLE
jgi:hypothetical protein